MLDHLPPEADLVQAVLPGQLASGAGAHVEIEVVKRS